jgi:two-component system, chemotaxis family, CheB/CheR fusion protein
MSAPPDDILVVGIGASAGGVDALRAFFARVPANSGCAYVVILHLSPEHESHLAAILQDVAAIPVTRVSEQVRVEPNCAYVVPPGQHLTMDDGELVVSPTNQPEERRAPVDLFFRTLADSQQERAVCVVLSGTGPNGSMGLKRVKECGGAIFVQDPREAAFGEMPRSAIATGLVDDVLPVAELPARIVAYRAGLATLGTRSGPERRHEVQNALREIFACLRASTGHDFSDYKRATMLRRIEHRIAVLGLPDLPSYAGFLHDHPGELPALLASLLISVTTFFRDRGAFAALEHDVLPGIFAGKGAGNTIRIWVVGCATGEEAYSVAMLCAERTTDLLDAPSVQIFATDIDEAAIARAREGLYTASDVAELSPERLRRFFAREGDRFRVRRELRERILFATHNILKDPPFSQIDLIACRNVLIYLNRAAQQRVAGTLHFALNPGGYLFLGTAEAPDEYDDQFLTISRENRVFQRRTIGPQSPRLPASRPPARTTPQVATPEAAAARAPAANQAIIPLNLHQRLLEQYAPPSLIITPDYDVIHVTPRAARYLRMAPGEPTTNLLLLIRPELLTITHAALADAIRRRVNVDTLPVPLRVDNHDEQVAIRVRPVLHPDDAAQGHILILFETGSEAHHKAEVLLRADEPAAGLPEEVARLRQELRASSAKYEYQAELLRSANEELQALNEELRTSSEEVETNKEELQALNEELRTVNQELKVTIEEATLHSTNLQNLINSAEIGTIFLNRALAIQLFTPAACRLFNLIPADRGRPLSDITHRMGKVDVLADAALVLETLQTIEREVHTTDGEVYLLRILPYRSDADRVGGVVLTFFEISERRQLEERLRESEARFRALVTANSYAVYRMSPDWSEMLQLDGQGFIASTTGPSTSWLDKYIDAEDQPRVMEAIQAAIQARSMFELEHRVRRADGSLGWTLSRAVPLLDESGEIAEWFGAASDVTARKAAEEAMRESEERFRSVFESIDEGFCIVELLFDAAQRPIDYRFLQVNPAFSRLTGLEAAPGRTARELVPTLEPFWFETYGYVALTGESVRFEHEAVPMERWFDVHASRVGGAQSRRVAIIFTNITERKRSDAKAQSALPRLGRSSRSRRG